MAMAKSLFPLETFALLGRSLNHDYRFTLQTPYGLVVELSAQGPVSIRLSDKTAATSVPTSHENAEPSPDEKPSDPESRSRNPEDSQGKPSGFESPPQSDAHSTPSAIPGYRIYVADDYHTNFLWWDADWPGNPSEVGPVDDDFLEANYSTAWIEAWYGWVEKYEQAFERNEVHLGSQKDVFEDAPSDRVAWDVEGILLATWLALQPRVERVRTRGYHGKKEYVITKDNAAEMVEMFLKDLRGMLCL